MPPDVPAAPRPSHLHRVQSLTDAALAHLTLEGLLDELLTRVRDLLSVDTAAVLLLDEEQQELIATAANGIEEEVEQGVRLPVGRGFAGTIAARAEPVILPSVDHTKVLNPLLLRRGIRSMLGVPIVVGGSVVGVLHVGTLQPRTFTSEDVELLQLVADRAALPLNARRHEQERTIAETIQRSLLPERLPRMPGVEVYGLYVPAGGGMVGGDWYDVFTLRSGDLCVVVGDTVGSGADAAIAMARLRDAVRTLAFVNGAPGEAITQLNDMIHHFDPDVMATLFLGMIDEVGELRFASAGHVPPILVDAGGGAEVLDVLAQPALGATSHRYVEQRRSIAGAASLMVYTDGLVERRGRSLDAGLEALRAAAEEPWSSVEELCARALGTEHVRAGLADDLAVVVLRFAPEHSGDLRLTVEADPRQLAGLRRALRRWCAEHGVTPSDTSDLLLAAGEALSNAIEHASGPGRGIVRLEVSMNEGVAHLTVADDGRWREPRGRGRGRGQALMAAVTDHLEVHKDEHGTTLKMQKVIRPDA